ncbi:MAG: nodulation protein NfeD [PVC group bacterium]|nr:nodulation protein NfeD [PVC group bacterium]
MKKILIFLFIFSLFFSIISLDSFSESISETIYNIPIKGVIDLGLSAFVKRSVQDAKDKNAKVVVLEIDTLGGRVDAAEEIILVIQELSIPTYAYITNNAWSAGALIALSCKEIIMKTGSSIGSAEPRTMGVSSSPEATDEKMISALRAKFRATAEANNHSLNLAQAMVDKDIELIQIDFKDENLILTKEELEKKKEEFSKRSFKNETVISPQGKLLNLTADESLNIKLSSLTVGSDKEFWDYIKNKFFKDLLENPKIIKPSLTWSENIVRVLTHPIVSSLLLTLGFLGLIFELKIPGWGIGGTLGVIFLILFFWGHYLVGLANWVDILIFVVGIGLIILEIFVIPGFGIAGVLGIIFIFTGLILTLVKNPFTMPSFELRTAFNIVSYAFISSFVLLVLSFKFIPRTAFWKRLQLDAEEKKGLGFQTKSLPEQICIGKIGQAKTILRPSGRAVFDNTTIDVTTFGEFIDKGKQIKIAKIEGNKVFVEKT